jgi:hypothetical protein
MEHMLSFSNLEQMALTSGVAARLTRRRFVRRRLIGSTASFTRSLRAFAPTC